MGNIDGNTFLTDSTLFPADVVANAGIEPSYRDILKGTSNNAGSTRDGN